LIYIYRDTTTSSYSFKQISVAGNQNALLNDCRGAYQCISLAVFVAQSLSLLGVELSHNGEYLLKEIINSPSGVIPRGNVPNR